MNKSSTLPEVFLSTSETSLQISRRLKRSLVRKIGPRLYTSNMDDAAEDIVRRNLWNLVAAYAPGALVSDRSAIEMAPASDGSFCIVSSLSKNIELPGLTIRTRRGAPPVQGDSPFMDGVLRLSSPHRAMLDNLSRSHAVRGRLPRTLGQEAVEAHMERVAAQAGMDALRRIVEAAAGIASQIDRKAEGQRLYGMFDELSGGVPGRLRSTLAKARAAGTPYSPLSIALCDRLVGALRSVPRPEVPWGTARKGLARDTLAFFEAYFSNYIEGTELTVDEAVGLIFKGQDPNPLHPADAHDMIGLWRIVSSEREMTRTPQTPDELLSLLRNRHAVAMEGRPAIRPGEFKSVRNRIGAKEFVAPELVVGTLREGFKRLEALESPFDRAVFMHFLVAETHPFVDGNGRMARVMMNAELVAGGLHPIVIPTAYRENYLAAQRSLSAGNSPDPLPQALHRIQRWTAGVPWGELEATAQALDARHAFATEAELDDLGLRLLDARKV